LAVLKLAVLVSGVLALAKFGFLDFITGGFDTGRFGGLSYGISQRPFDSSTPLVADLAFSFRNLKFKNTNIFG
jgi:hypothetical protein